MESFEEDRFEETETEQSYYETSEVSQSEDNCNDISQSEDNCNEISQSEDTCNETESSRFGSQESCDGFKAKKTKEKKTHRLARRRPWNSSPSARAVPISESAPTSGYRFHKSSSDERLRVRPLSREGGYRKTSVPSLRSRSLEKETRAANHDTTKEERRCSISDLRSETVLLRKTVFEKEKEMKAMQKTLMWQKEVAIKEALEEQKARLLTNHEHMSGSRLTRLMNMVQRLQKQKDELEAHLTDQIRLHKEQNANLLLQQQLHERELKSVLANSKRESVRECKQLRALEETIRLKDEVSTVCVFSKLQF